MSKLTDKQIFAARPEYGRAFLRLYDGKGLFIPNAVKPRPLGRGYKALGVITTRNARANRCG